MPKVSVSPCFTCIVRYLGSSTARSRDDSTADRVELFFATTAVIGDDYQDLGKVSELCDLFGFSFAPIRIKFDEGKEPDLEVGKDYRVTLVPAPWALSREVSGLWFSIVGNFNPVANAKPKTA